jgi:uncharacterized protein (DUF736 family)
MAIIGTFTKQDGGTFAGTLATLSVKAKVNIIPVDKTGASAPDYRVYAGNADLGAAWSVTSEKSGKPYLRVKLDDPSFPAPILARLVEMEKGHALVWSRPV